MHRHASQFWTNFDRRFVKRFFFIFLKFWSAVVFWIHFRISMNLQRRKAWRHEWGFGMFGHVGTHEAWLCRHFQVVWFMLTHRNLYNDEQCRNYLIRKLEPIWIQTLGSTSSLSQEQSRTPCVEWHWASFNILKPCSSQLDGSLRDVNPSTQRMPVPLPKARSSDKIPIFMPWTLLWWLQCRSQACAEPVNMMSSRPLPKHAEFHPFHNWWIHSACLFTALSPIFGDTTSQALSRLLTCGQIRTTTSWPRRRRLWSTGYASLRWTSTTWPRRWGKILSRGHSTQHWRKPLVVQWWFWMKKWSRFLASGASSRLLGWRTCSVPLNWFAVRVPCPSLRTVDTRLWARRCSKPHARPCGTCPLPRLKAQ